ncbi:hypothetical protein QCA50_020003 [Cerrena zonata]|uniref:Uncharacterized protein n=1 Tax=Cerrena zonata TaxID=2478898 RepID=A0AAW0F9R3_9APHY
MQKVEVDFFSKESQEYVLALVYGHFSTLSPKGYYRKIGIYCSVTASAPSHFADIDIDMLPDVNSPNTIQIDWDNPVLDDVNTQENLLSPLPLLNHPTNLDVASAAAAPESHPLPLSQTIPQTLSNPLLDEPDS